jgi:hypothetical protein
MTLGSGLGGREAERETGWADVRRVSPYAALSPTPSAPPASPYVPSPSSPMSSSSLSPYAFLIFVSAGHLQKCAEYLKHMTTKKHAVLRKVIREMLDEMALGAVMPTLDLKRKQDPSIDKGYGLDPDAPKMTSKSIDRYHRTPMYSSAATAAFKMFPYDVFIVPVATRKLEIMGELIGNRVKVYGREDGLKRLAEMAVEHELEVDVDDLRKKLEGGGTVILALTQQLRQGFLPTPWMLVHALFEGDYTHFEEEKLTFEDAMEEMDLSPKRMMKFATMKSARDNNVLTDSDFTSEVFAQAVITKKGAYFDKEKAKNPETAEKLTRLEDIVNKEINIRQKVFNLLRGKLISINGFVNA